MTNTSAARNGKDRSTSDFVEDDVIQVSSLIEMVAITVLTPAKVNDSIYKPVSPDDPSIISLSKDMKDLGLVLEALVVSLDDVIVSGHRRRAAAILAGFEEVPVRRINILSTDPRFEKYLVSFNQQRSKTTAERIREEVVRTSPEAAHLKLLAHRKIESLNAHKRAEKAGLRVLSVSSARKRSEITWLKQPMLDAAIEVLNQYTDYWPLTVRQVHYRLLTKSFYRNAQTKTHYRNTEECYKDLSNLLVRAREDGQVPWESIHDPTRPRTDWRQWDNAGAYITEQLKGFLCDYKRDLLQSQPAYVELVVEKITVQEIAERAAMHYHVPVGVGRGYSSVTSLNDTAERFRASGKDRFILLIAGDLDPEGENICQTWANCLRDEHGVEDITPVKVALNPSQAREYNLSPLPVKETSSRAASFKKKHGNGAYELEAFEPDLLQTIIRNSIRDVLDLDKFEEERRKESEEARHLLAYQAQVREVLKECDPIDESLIVKRDEPEDE